MENGTLTFSPPELTDGKAVHDLIANCPPLDLNTTYNYFLLCSHFAETCVVGRRGDRILSFLSAYRIPGAPERLFIWQAAVDSQLRGQGVAGSMLAELLERPACAGVRYIETTVSPSNRASRRVFERFAEERRLGFADEEFLTASMFGDEQHEAEILYRIGPLDA